jgi:hypothetical protein
MFSQIQSEKTHRLPHTLQQPITGEQSATFAREFEFPARCQKTKKMPVLFLAKAHFEEAE